MKAKFFFLGLCALALAACSLDEVSQVNDTNAIKFKATTATRATAVTTNNLSEFSVWAWNEGNEFMDDVIATKSGSSFVTSPLYFWPTGTVDFYALVPSTTVKAMDLDENDHEVYYLGGELDPNHELTEDGTQWVYTGNVAQAHIADGEIVIDTYVPSLAEEQIDLCYAVAKDQSSGSVPMNFRHALSQVAFKVMNSNSAFVVDIQEISLCSVYKSGTLTITDTTTTNLPTPDLGIDEGLAQGVWVVNKTDEYEEQLKGRFVPGITPTVLNGIEDGTVDVTTDPLMLIPQTVVGWDVYTDQYDEQLGSYIRILCNVMENGSQLWPNSVEEDYDAKAGEDDDHPIHRVNGKEYAEIAVPITDAVWEQGYRYTYTLIFGDGIGYYPPDDPNTDLDGTPILVPITFDVTVDEFQDADNSKGDYDFTTDTDVIVTTAADLLAAFKRGLSPIEIAADITLDEDLWLDSGATIDIIIDEDCTLYINNINDGLGAWDAFFVENGSTLNIYGDGAVKCVNPSDKDGEEFYAVWVYGGGTVNIYGCTFEGSPDCVYVEEGTANIYGGTYYATCTWRDTYWLLNCYNSAWKDGIAHIYVYGGTYCEFDPSNPNTDDADSYVADGYGVVTSTDDEGNTWYTVVCTKVTSLTDLKSLISEGASEITIDEAIELDQGDVLYFTNDCHLTLNADLTYAPVSSYTGGDDGTTSLSIIVVGNGATLTIDAADGVNIACDGNNGNNGDDWVSCISVGTYFTSTTNYDAGHLIINGGNYKGGVWNDTDNNYTSVPTIYIFCGDVEINGGNFVGGWSKWSGSGYTYKDTGWAANTLNCLDAPRKANTETETYAWFFVKGGSFREFNPANNASEGNNTDYVVSGYTSTSSTGTDGFTWWTVTKD